MPKINVYLPDELAEGVKAAGVPISAICQRALEQSVRRVSAIRATVLGDLETDDPTAQLSQFTERARNAIKLGIEQARGDGAAEVGTGHLLRGVLAEGANLALHVLRAEEIDPAALARALERAAEPEAAETPAARFSGAAANALELTVIEALGLGHNYVGCEHLLLGLIGEADGAAGRALREAGLEARSARRSVVAALSGCAHLRAQAAGQPDPASLITAAVRKEVAPLLDRIERLERQAGAAAEG